MDHNLQSGSLDTSSLKNSTKLRPTNIGNYHDIPDDLCTMTRLERNEVVAWTTFSSEYENKIDMSGTFFFILTPCFWPLWITCCPLLCALKISTKRTIKNTFWVLTETDLKIIVKNHDDCCFPGCYHVGDAVKSIPYENITDCRATSPAKGCFGGHAAIPTIYVAAVKNADGPCHGVVGHGLAGYDWFATEILVRQKALKDFHYMHLLHGIAMSNMDRGTNESVESRSQKITELHELGMISTEEYEKKRGEILASL
jgi:hypothetical protein